MKNKIVSGMLCFALILPLPLFGQTAGNKTDTTIPKQKLTIEWKHLEKDGITCVRCSNTGKTLLQVIEEMKKTCKKQQIEIEFKETKLAADRIKESNEILMNGIPIEKILSNAQVFESDCPSCSSITGQSNCCRGIKIEEKKYEEIPEEMIWKSACKLLKCELLGKKND
ncbi:MAG: DUF2703 domain-containing protein [Candidatus Riflebacteria bacterium]|nr:DUF2703 domain-containing protein [Candidatus Riflebacteria bacterium]